MDNNTPEASIIANFEEPKIPQSVSHSILQKRLILFATVTFIIMIAIGVWMKDWTFYLAAGVVGMASFSILAQHKNAKPQSIAITNEVIQIGQKIIQINDLIGFWLEREQEYIGVNLVRKHREIIPASFLFPTQNPDEVREIMLQILPEIEPPETTSNGFGNFLGW